MIEQSEQLKSAAESHAANLADKLVPYTLVGSALSYLRRRYPQQPAQFLIQEWDDRVLEALEKYNLGLDIYYKSATAENVQKVHALGQEYNVWTVNEAADGAALVEMGVDYITTNILEGTVKAE